MKILVLNSGSSSIKYQFIEMDNEEVICQGLIERIGASSGIINHYTEKNGKYSEVTYISDHSEGIERLLGLLLHKEFGVIKDLNEISAVGHRIVHGGEYFSQSVLITKEVIDKIIECTDLAPLHNPHNLKGIIACKELLPAVKQVAVFDTAFHQTLEEHVYLYALPISLYKKYSIRRYGFHGTSHYYVSQVGIKDNNLDINNCKIITCHLGNGSSITAIKNGKSVDTSMGFTPLEGLIMGTRCGDIDPAVILHITEKEELTLKEANFLMNKHSGLLGISGLTNDVRELVKEMEAGNARATLAIKMFCYRLKKYICAYIGVLGGVDLIVFTGGIGENSDIVRKITLENLEWFGIILDEELNKEMKLGKKGLISAKDSRVKIEVIPTNEELVIARDTLRIIKQGSDN
ncbi:MAG TPA: acetate kinase [bacterium]|nr:acetate kinase [bacterium]HOL46643.1 acetate kinase [bacterium]HPQ17786.1 acetate kinase [bacterium]